MFSPVEAESGERPARSCRSLHVDAKSDHPGAGKSTVARILADRAQRSVLLDGDVFFGFLRRGAIMLFDPVGHSEEVAEVVEAGCRNGLFT